MGCRVSYVLGGETCVSQDTLCPTLISWPRGAALWDRGHGQSVKVIGGGSAGQCRQRPSAAVTLLPAQRPGSHRVVVRQEARSSRAGAPVPASFVPSSRSPLTSGMQQPRCGLAEVLPPASPTGEKGCFLETAAQPPRQRHQPPCSGWAGSACGKPTCRGL